MTPPFHVSYSGTVRASLKRLLEEAAGRNEDFGRRALAAAREIDARLRADARDVGEPSYSLPALALDVRRAVVRPLAVTFAVHQQRAVVFVRRFDLLSGPP